MDKITDIESLNFKDSISVIVSTNFDVCDGEDGEDSSTIPSVNPSRHRKACRLAGHASVLDTLIFYGMLEGGESHHIIKDGLAASLYLDAYIHIVHTFGYVTAFYTWVGSTGSAV